MYNKIIKTSIYALVFLMPLFFLPFSFEAFEFNKQYLLFFLVSLAFFAWLAKMVLVDKEIRFKRSPLDIFVLVFLFIAILSAIFSVDKGSSLFGFYGRFSDGLIGLLSLGIFYFLLTNNVVVAKEENKKEKSLNTAYQIPYTKIIKVFTWSVFFVIIFSYLSVFTIWTQIDNMLGDKLHLPTVMLQSIFNPAAGSMEGLAVFLAVFTTLLAGIFVTGGKKKRGNFFTWLLLVLSLGLLIIIDFTPAWLALSVGLFLFLVIVLWRRTFKEDVNKLLLPIILVVIGGIFLFINTSNFEYLGIFQMPKEQVISEKVSWASGFGSATENVKSGFLGSGIGTFNYDFAKFKPVTFNENLLWQIRFDRAGSYFAELLGTVGFLGILSYLGLIGVFLLISWYMASVPQAQNTKYQMPLLMAFLVLIVSQFFYYQNTTLAFAFWLVLGLSVVNWQKPVQEKTISFKDFPELSLVFSALLIVFGLVILGMYFFAANFYLADINYKNATGAERIQKLEKAAGLNPYQSQYKIVLGRDYLAKVLEENQKPEEQKDQTALSTNVHLAITYGKGGQIGTNIIKGATELSPNRVAAWETLGMIYRDIQGIATGALEWGIKSFEKSIDLEPANPVLHTELGKLYLTSGDKEMARQEFSKTQQLKPDYIDASIQMALIYEGEDNIEEAIRQIETLANTYSLNVEVLFQLGRLYFNADRTDDAILQFQAITILMPNHSNAHYSLGVAYQKKGQTSKAIAEYEKVLELNPGNQDVQEKLDQLRK